MRELSECALTLGCTLFPYAADMQNKPPGLRNHRQARNLAAAMTVLAEPQRCLVWCGNHQISDRRLGLACAMRRWQARGVTLGDVLGEHLLEPVVREWLVVECRHLNPAGGAIEGERLGEDRARLDARDPRAARQRGRLESLQ
jgi:hypothetical protein